VDGFLEPVLFCKKHRQSLQGALRLPGLEEVEEINEESPHDQ
jgi:hypothetical protein